MAPEGEPTVCSVPVFFFLHLSASILDSPGGGSSAAGLAGADVWNWFEMAPEGEPTVCSVPFAFFHLNSSILDMPGGGCIWALGMRPLRLALALASHPVTASLVASDLCGKSVGWLAGPRRWFDWFQHDQ